MITGIVTAERETLVQVLVRGPNGRERQVVAILDTGFSEFLTLPSSTVAFLDLPELQSNEMTLADDTVVEVPVHKATILWDGAERSILLHRVDGTPLLGMGPVFSHVLTLEGRRHDAARCILEWKLMASEAAGDRRAGGRDWKRVRC